MENNQNFELFLDTMLDTAVKEFHATPQYFLLKEKLEQMDLECDIMFPLETDREFVDHCLSLLTEISGHQEKYIYLKGYQDCIKLLKRLDIL